MKLLSVLAFVQPWRFPLPVLLQALGLLAGSVVFLWLALGQQRRRRSGSAEKKMKLPPGPVRWPVVGCLPAVGFKHRHRTFFKLSKKYGPVMQVPIGAAKLIVVHGPAMARELLKTRDAHFCSRPLSMTGTYLGFDHADVNLSPYNPNWQLIRKALSLHLLSPSKLAAQAAKRRQIICSSITSLFHHQADAVVNVSAFADKLMTSITVQMLFGERYSFDDGKNQACHRQSPAALAISKALLDFDPDLREAIYLWGELNLADFFPTLAPWDIQGLECRFRVLRKKLEWLFGLIIQEHRDSLHGDQEDDDDFISVLLAQKQLSDKQLMGIMSNALIAGIDTTARAIEWAMAELVANPAAMSKAQEELDRVVGEERLVNEMDIEDLPYLQAISKEVLRLHPSAPLDDPHLNEEPSTLGGYYIPAKSIILHNLWALGQDDSIWHNPTHFEPDRFLKSPVNQAMNVYGSHFELLPFSSGRRRCPAYQFATLALQHVVGVLLHAFDWFVPSPGVLNLEESDGIVVGLKHPLMLRSASRLPPSATEL